MVWGESFYLCASGCPLGFGISRDFGGGALPCLLVSNRRGLFSITFFRFNGGSAAFFSGAGKRFLSTFVISRLRGTLLVFAALGKGGFGALEGADTAFGGDDSGNVGTGLLAKAGKAGLGCAMAIGKHNRSVN